MTTEQNTEQQSETMPFEDRLQKSTDDALKKEMGIRGLLGYEVQTTQLSETMTLGEFWQNAPENKLIDAYRQLEQYDINSREAICAEIKKRGLEAKAANKGYRVYKVDLEKLGEVSFDSILKFVWKWAWACVLVSIPIGILYFLAMAGINKIIAESKPKPPARYYGY